MNNIFVLKRFFLLFRKHSIDNAKTYSLLFIGITATFLVSFLVTSSSNHGVLTLSKQFNIFFYITIFSGTIITSRSFSALGIKNKSVTQLVLPASHFEKFTVSWLYSYVFFQLLCIVSFYLSAYIAIHYAQQASEKKLNFMLDVFSSDQKAAYTFLAFSLLHSLYFWGAIFFKNLHFLKTTVVLLGTILFLILINKLILSLIIDQKLVINLPFEGLRFIEDKSYKHIHIHEKSMLFNGALISATVILLWVSAFFTLKEKEI